MPAYEILEIFNEFREVKIASYILIYEGATSVPLTAEVRQVFAVLTADGKAVPKNG